MKNILVSMCLVGVNCKYNGENNYSKKIEEIIKGGEYNVIPVCPEIMGGLQTPRKPNEIREGRVVTKDGDDFTEEFIKGANEVLKLAEMYDVEFCILKERSPSCGSNFIYDGSFTGKLTEGDGITAKLLKENGYKVYRGEEL